LSKVSAWAGGTHFSLTAGKDLTEQFNSCHATISRVEETYDFSHNWVRYITPLVDRALEEANGGINLEHLFQKPLIR